MSYKEDDLTKSLIKHHQDRDHVRIIEPEAHYDHYGKQGWPDLYVVFNRIPENLIEHHLIEVKSEHAVRQATGANEIIRQFNQMRWYFFEDDRRNVHQPRSEYEDVVLVFELTFIPTEYNILHLFDNKEIYNQAITSDSLDPVDKLPDNQTNTNIHNGIEVYLTLRHPADARSERVLISNNGWELTSSDDPIELIERYENLYG